MADFAELDRHNFCGARRLPPFEGREDVGHRANLGGRTLFGPLVEQTNLLSGEAHSNRRGHGEAPLLHIQLTNASKRSFTVFETSTQREFEVRAVDAHGSEASLTERARNMRGMGPVPDVVFRNFPMTVQAGEALSSDEDPFQGISSGRTR